MKRYTVRPYDDYKSWGDYDTIEEAREVRSNLAMSFFSRRVVSLIMMSQITLTAKR